MEGVYKKESGAYMQKVIEIKDGIARKPEWRMKTPVNFELLSGEQLAVIGKNASGKSMFIDMLTGKHPLVSDNSLKYDFSPDNHEYASDNIKYIRFKDSYGSDTDRAYYMQQRWNQGELGDSYITVAHKVKTEYGNLLKKVAEDDAYMRLYNMFSIDTIMDKRIISLSSGELRRLILALAILNQPRILIIDNPFIGLDCQTREMLKAILKTLCETQIIQLILVVDEHKEIPDFITHVIEVCNMSVMPKQTREEYVSRHNITAAEDASHGYDRRNEIIKLPYENDKKTFSYEYAIRMRDVTISYGNNLILNKINWCVKNGERWAITGRNGSGKSTLLSIVCADNPQSYACDVTLFDKRRGCGESIWEIKRHIGYVSPEMHRAFKHDIPAINIVRSGLDDSKVINRRLTEETSALCHFWMDRFGIEHLAERTFLKMSSGEQRLVLLARAFVKDPELLILDEPLHGLDNDNKTLANNIIDAFCERKNKTLIVVTHYKEELPRCIDRELKLEKS